MHIISITGFRYYAQKRLILPAECSRQKSLILHEILPAEFKQAYFWEQQTELLL